MTVIKCNNDQHFSRHFRKPIGRSDMSQFQNKNQAKGINPLARGISLGMICGAPLGIFLGAILENMAFIGVGVGFGLSVGLAISAASELRRNADDY